jgi:uncharacterized protein (DUF58 family)
MKPETQEMLYEITRRVVSCAIPLRWRSSSIMPGAGERRSFQRGSSGYELAARAEYEPGDDPRDIDWAATAQTGGQTVYTTQYQEPRDVNVFVLADVNPTMIFGTARTFKKHLTAEMAGSIIKSAEETNDRVGFIAYSSHSVVSHFTARAPKRLFAPALVSLLEANSTASGEGSGLLKALALLPRKRSLVFVLSDFFHLSSDEKAALKRAATTHDVVCVVIQDRRERELPAPPRVLGIELPSIITLEDLRTGERRSIWLSKKNRKAFADNFQRHQAQLFADLKEAHCEKEVFSTEEGEAAIPKMMRLFGGHRR